MHFHCESLGMWDYVRAHKVESLLQCCPAQKPRRQNPLMERCFGDDLGSGGGIHTVCVCSFPSLSSVCWLGPRVTSEKSTHTTHTTLTRNACRSTLSCCLTAILTCFFLILLCSVTLLKCFLFLSNSIFPS